MMFFRIKILTLLLMVFWGQVLVAQSFTDTLQQVYGLINSARYNEAVELLSVYSQTPADKGVGWLYAQTLYKAGKLNRSLEQYNLRYSAFRNNPDYLTERANLLLEMARYSEAERSIAAIPHQTQPSDLNVKLAYWRGDLKTAKTLSKTSAMVSPLLKRDVKVATSGTRLLHVGFATDNQPLSVLKVRTAIGFFIGNIFSPGIIIERVNGFDKERWSLLGFANQSSLFKLRTKTNIELGFMRHPASDKPNLNFRLETQTRIWRNQLSINTELYSQPLSNLRSNFDTLTRPFSSGLSFDFTKPQWFSLSGKLYNHRYSDGNQNGVYVYANSPNIELKSVNAILGACYAYNNSDADRFTAKKSIDSILAQYTDGYNIEGEYLGYFSPKNQSVVSVFAHVSTKVNKFLSVSVRANYGVFASLNNPYLFLDQHPETNALFINKGFYRHNYHPFELGAGAHFLGGRYLDVKLEYMYASLFYFETHNITLILKHLRR